MSLFDRFRPPDALDLDLGAAAAEAAVRIDDEHRRAVAERIAREAEERAARERTAHERAIAEQAARTRVAIAQKQFRSSLLPEARRQAREALRLAIATLDLEACITAAARVDAIERLQKELL